VAILVNNTAGALTVSRSVAGTTIGTYSVRLVVATDAQLSGQTYVQLGTIVVSGAAITSITPSYAMYGTTTQLPYQSYATMSGGTATLTVSLTAYDVTGYSSSSVSADNIFSVNTTTGAITIQRTGWYTFTQTGTYSTGTTGYRGMQLFVGGTAVYDNRAAALGVASHQVANSGLFEITTAGSVVIAKVFANVASQSFASGRLTISRA